MRYIILALVIIGCGDFESVETSQALKVPCQKYQGDYSHTMIRCGDYYVGQIVLCDDNGNYDRGKFCCTSADLQDIVSENKPCPNCGCIVENVCDR